MTGEGRMVRNGVLAGIAAVPVAALAAFATRGPDGAAGAAIALGLVLANFAVSGALLVWTKRNPILFPTLGLPSYAFRMLGVLMAMKALKETTFIDHPTFAVTFGAGVVALLAYECLLYARTPWLALSFTPKTITKETT